MIAVYCRVSSEDQRTDSQVAEINRWLSGHGYMEEQVRWFQDKEIGATLARPEFDKLQSAIFNGEVDTVVCWKLDRLSRTLKDGVDLVHRWTQQSIRIVVTTMELDLSGEIGQMVAALMFALAAIERKNIRQRQAAGIAVARKRGVYKGRKPGTLKANPERARQLYDKGNTVPEIAAALQTSERTVWRYLQAVSSDTA